MNKKENKLIRRKQEMVAASETVRQEHSHEVFQLSLLNACFQSKFLSDPSFSTYLYYPMTAHREVG